MFWNRQFNGFRYFLLYCMYIDSRISVILYCHEFYTLIVPPFHHIAVFNSSSNNAGLMAMYIQWGNKGRHRSEQRVFVVSNNDKSDFFPHSRSFSLLLSHSILHRVYFINFSQSLFTIEIPLKNIQFFHFVLLFVWDLLCMCGHSSSLTAIDWFNKKKKNRKMGNNENFSVPLWL